MILKTSYKMKPPVSCRLIRGHPLADFVAFWPFNEGSGGQVFDLSGKGNTGTLQGTAPSWSAGKFGSAVLLPGTDEYILVGDRDSLDCQSITIITHLKINAFPAAANYIVAKMEDYVDGGEMSYGLYLKNDGNFVWLVSEDGESPAGAEETTGTPFLAGGTYQIAVTYSPGDYRCYADGLRTESDGGGSETGNIYQGTGRFVIGARYDLGDVKYKLFSNVLINYMAIYNRALSPSEIALLYLKPFCMFERKARPLYAAPAVIAARPRSHVGFRPIEGADRLRGLRRNALY